MNKQKFDKIKLSDNERLKLESNFLRGTIEQDLYDELTGGFNGDNFQLIRFHGMYQQDDRDLRGERLEQKLEPLINMMLRCRLPGGVITPVQWIGIDNFAKDYTLYSSIRLTTRQTFQLHGILKPKLKMIHSVLHNLGLDSIATAGDVNRNVLCTSNPMESELHNQVWYWAKKISLYFLPKSRAYAEIWLNGKKTETTDIDIDQEPILGSTYLPRKFKIAIAIPPQNDVDIHANDISLIAISKNSKLIGFNVLVGGGLAITYGDVSTYPRKASEFGYISLNGILKIVEAIVTTQRDWGNRINRKYAKTKYTLDRVGINKFKSEVEIRSGIKFCPIVPYVLLRRGDHFGWVHGINDRWHLTVFIENGRILDYQDKLLKTGLSEIACVHSGVFRLTSNQNLIIADVKEKDKVLIEHLAQKYKLIEDHITLQRKSSMACVSFPTCPLAMAEAERFLPKFITKVEKIMHKYDIINDAVVLRITGCPNGCGRAMLAEIGLVGKSLGRYNLYLGGNYEGTRIPRLYLENVAEDKILDVLDDTIGRWSRERFEKESYGDYVIRAGIVAPVLNSTKDFYIASVN